MTNQTELTITEILSLSNTDYGQLLSDSLDSNEDNYYTTSSCDYDTCFYCDKNIEEDEGFYLVNGNPMCEEDHAKRYNNAFEWELQIMSESNENLQ